MNRLEKLMESRPATALRAIKEFEESAVWEYITERLSTLDDIFTNKLLVCDLNEVEIIRSKISSNRDLLAIPETIRESIKDEIELKREAEKIEKARTP